MDPRYNAIYENLYRQYPAQTRLPRAGGPRDAAIEIEIEIDKAIDEVSKQVKLRADAKYFLKLNLLEVCVYPIMANDPQLRDDAVKLAVESVHQAGRALRGADPLLIPRDSKGEVSGGQVVRLLGLMWNDLAIHRLRIWDESVDE